MIFLDNKTDFDLDIDRLENISDSLTNRDIELVLCDNEYIAELNKEYRRKDKPTDVLSFPLEGNMPHTPLGSIVISYDQALSVSRELGHTCSEEVSLLFIHGLLHLMGYDHENDAGEMREQEHELIGKFHLPASLIVRSEPHG
jgi:probable rRNA maturation factor